MKLGVEGGIVARESRNKSKHDITRLVDDFLSVKMILCKKDKSGNQNGGK